MKKKKTKQAERPPKQYNIVTDSQGFTPRQAVDLRRAQLLQLEIAEKKGALVDKETVEAGLREAAEVIQSDLFGALPSRCASELAGKKLDAETVRSVIIKIVSDMVGNWMQAEIVKMPEKE